MEVIALVGPTGTGKSHRASLLAIEHGADAIIDDGLLIQDAKIVAGVSAKREANALAAVRRAIFQDEEHALAVRRALEQGQPQRILVLGTSRKMVHNICDRLHIPRPSKYIEITDIATEEEIRQARRTRLREGKHVIPAPTLEVKKSFSGYWIDPLRFFYRKNKGDSRSLIEKSLVRPTFNSFGKFYIADSAIAAICEKSILEIEGISTPLRIVVKSNPEGVRIKAECSVYYGIRIKPVLRRAQQHAREKIETLTSLNVLGLDVIARRLVQQPVRSDVLEVKQDG